MFLLACAGCADEGHDSAEAPGFTAVAPAEVVGWQRTVATPRDAWERDRDLEVGAAELWGPFGACSTDVPLVEEQLIEFNTTGCSAYSSRAPIPVDIEAGSVVEIVISHSALFAPDAARGRMIVQWAGEDLVLWERAIPSPSDIQTTLWRTERAWDAGTLLSVHVSNHGANAWYLVAVNVLTPP